MNIIVTIPESVGHYSQATERFRVRNGATDDEIAEHIERNWTGRGYVRSVSVFPSGKVMLPCAGVNRRHVWSTWRRES